MKKKAFVQTAVFLALCVLLLFPEGNRSAKREKRMGRTLPEPKVEWKL